MSPSLLAALVAALGVTAGGCRGKRAAPPPSRDAGVAVVGPAVRALVPRPRDVPFDEPRVPMPREVRATLLEPGAPPRAVRRYQPAADTRELHVTIAITSRAYRHGAWLGPTTLPPIREGFGTSVEPSPDGALVLLRGLTATIDAPAGAGATPATPAAIDAGTANDPAAAPPGRADADAYLGRWRALVERRRVAMPIDDRGRLGAIVLQDDPAGTRPDADETRDELAQRWLGLAVPLPAEPIGVGARWQVETLLRTGGAVLSQHATYRLAAIDGATWTIELELIRLGEYQLIAIPGLSADVTAELIALRRAVTGTLTLGPTSPLPRAGRLTSTSAVHARFTAAGGQPVDEVSDDTATITIE